MLDGDGPERFLEWIEHRGVELADHAIPDERDVVVAAGIGSQEPWAKSTARTQSEIEAALEPCARALAETKETFVLFETVSTPPELAAVAAVARRAELQDFGLGVSCGPDGRTWGGVSMSEVAGAFAGTSVAALFVQCTRYDVASTGLQSLVAALAQADGLDAVPGV